ncbi:MAG: metal-dependent transcriptional regulator [Halapricum sp.]
MLSPEMEDYLKAIHEHQRETAGPVSTSTIAESMDVTPPTATSMMEKLEDRGFVEREKYKGVRLTEEGETIAVEVIRHHRLLETYLTDKLGFDWTDVHEEADRLEHHISEEFERRVAAQLDDPDVDPHGDPIPSDALEPLEGCVGTALSECHEGDTIEVTRVRDRDPDELDYLSEAGIVPGTTLTVVDVPPIGLLEVELEDGTRVSLPEHVAATIRVTEAGG